MVDFAKRFDMKKLFDSWVPSQQRARRNAHPVDQRVVVAMSPQERNRLVKDVQKLQDSGEKTSLSTYVRAKSRSTIDINEWRVVAERELLELDDLQKNKNAMRREIRKLSAQMENTDDSEEIVWCEKEIAAQRKELARLKARPTSRNQRLTGRMTFVESENIKWRAQKLSITTSDLLRMLIFDGGPATVFDKHMSVESRMRFYLSIIAVSNEGWGTPETVSACRDCAQMQKKVDKLTRENEKLKEKIMLDKD